MVLYQKSRRKDNIGVGSLHCDGLVYTDSLDKANVLNRHFPQSSILKIPHIYQQFMNITSQPCTQLQLVLQVSQSCFQILNHAFKASGPDDIPAYLLKEIAFQIAPSLAMVFQVSLNQCKLAADRKVAHMVPVFKKGDKSSPHNYRPISLTCLCYKILEHIVYSNIFMHLN